MKLKYLLITSVLVFPFSVGAGEMENKQAFEKLDVNKDGTISREEAANQQQLVESWKKYDTNTDDKIEYSEFSAFEEATGGKTFVPREDEDAPGVGAAPTD